MNVVIQRTPKGGYTPGTMFINGLFFAHTLEDQDRGLRNDMPFDEIKKRKVYGLTCIPYGKYKIKITYSPKFRKLMPQIMDVPGFDGIRVHGVRNIDDTYGCPGIGERDADGDDSTLHNGPAYTKRFTAMCMEADKRKEQIEIEIR